MKRTGLPLLGNAINLTYKTSVKKLEELSYSCLIKTRHGDAGRLVNPDLQVEEQSLENGTGAEEADVRGQLDVVVQDQEDVPAVELRGGAQQRHQTLGFSPLKIY